MKNLFVIINLFGIIVSALQTNIAAGQTACCPEFVLKDAIDICPPPGACRADSSLKDTLVACQNTAHLYTVYPNDPSFTYTWTITGGTPTSFTGNPLTVVWGSGCSGVIKVVISNLASGGTCLSTIVQHVCLIDGPDANFTVSGNTVCMNTIIHFTNTSIGGFEYHWDFGDGTGSSFASPDHSYNNPGTFTVTLTATDMGAGYIPPDAKDSLVPCGCTDVISKVIVVLPGEGPKIDTTCCFGTLCAPGAKSSFCTSTICSGYNWSVTGGSIFSGTGTNCITVEWNSVYSGPTTVTLQCPSSACTGSTTLYVPVLYPNLPITGPSQLCIGASGTFSIATLPGTYYTWTVTGGGYTFNKRDRNTTTVNITFLTTANYTVRCDYQNPLAGCSGSNTFTVNVKPVFSISGPDKVCEGATESYYASYNASWVVTPAGATLPAGQGSSKNITWNIPGFYTITSTPTISNLFCNPDAIKAVEVFALPVLDNIAGDDSVCPGKNYSYTIMSNVTGSPFFWWISSGTGIIHSQTGVDNNTATVEFTGSGPWTLSVRQTIEIKPGDSCVSLTKSKTVFSFLAPKIFGTTKVCTDDIKPYSAGGSNPDGDFQWSITPSNRGTIISGQHTNSVLIRWHGPSITCTLTVSNCAGSVNEPITIVDPPFAFITPYTEVLWCKGDNQTVTLSTPSSSGYTYQWYNANGAISLETNPTLTLTNTLSNFPDFGMFHYYVVVTQNGCTVTSNIVYVIIGDCSGGGCCIPGPGCGLYAFFSYQINCGTITLTDHSGVTPPATITSYQWSVTGPGIGTFSPGDNVQNPVLTVTVSGVYIITLTVTDSNGCVKTWSETVNILANINFTYGTPVCALTPDGFTADPNIPDFTYKWDFGDGSTSYTQSTTHAYVSAGSYSVTLTISNKINCVKSMSYIVTVKPLPNCTITANPASICPGKTSILTACPSSVMSTYQWYKEGNPISSANSASYSAGLPGEYYVSVSNSNGCYIKSNSIYIYLNSLPLAKISGDVESCTVPSAVKNFQLSAAYNSSYSYSWSSNPPGPTFTPNASNAAANTTISLTLPPVLPVTYEFTVTVTDQNGCTATDKKCITFYPTPALSVNQLYICEGSAVTLTPTPNDPGRYSYQWSNGSTTGVIVAYLSGFYSLIITDKQYGCSAYAAAGSIYPKPDLSLFPLGCDTICSTENFHLYIPLPLNALPPDNSYPSAYSAPTGITWYDNGSQVGTGENLNFLPGITGDHRISVTVRNRFNCKDTSAIYCLYVTPCEPCENCCKNFNIQIEQSSVVKMGLNWYVKSKLTTGPYRLFEIRAAMVNFYMNEQEGCERCVSPNLFFGSMIPTSNPGPNQTSQISWIPPSGSWINPILPPFSGSILNTNPREFVWQNMNNGQYISRPKLSNEWVYFRIIFPPPFQNQCCQDTIKFCIRWSFTDTTCRICDTLLCYTVIPPRWQGEDNIQPRPSQDQIKTKPELINQRRETEPQINEEYPLYKKEYIPSQDSLQKMLFYQQKRK